MVRPAIGMVKNPPHSIQSIHRKQHFQPSNSSKVKQKNLEKNISSPRSSPFKTSLHLGVKGLGSFSMAAMTWWWGNIWICWGDKSPKKKVHKQHWYTLIGGWAIYVTWDIRLVLSKSCWCKLEQFKTVKINRDHTPGCFLDGTRIKIWLVVEPSKTWVEPEKLTNNISNRGVSEISGFNGSRIIFLVPQHLCAWN